MPSLISPYRPAVWLLALSGLASAIPNQAAAAEPAKITRILPPPGIELPADWRAGIEAARSCSDPLSRLAVHTHVLAPWLAGSYGTHEGLLGSAADGGVLRWLRICREDVLDAVTRGGVVIDAVLAGRGDPPVDGYDTGGSAAAVGRVLAALMGD